MEIFKLTADAADAIIAHGRAGYPEEVCGLVAGLRGVGTTVHRGRNVSARPETAFELDTETLAAQIAFEEQGMILAAIYHSHPRGPATPSAEDIALAFYPDTVQIICSLETPERPDLRGFRIAGRRVWEVRLLQVFDI